MAKDQEHVVLPLSATTTTTSNARQSDGRKPNVIRDELTVFAGEFVGTFLFLFFAFAGTQIAVESTPPTPAGQQSPPDPAKLLYIAFSFGAGLAINVAIFADISGGMFNPAVTLGLLLTNKIPWQRALHSILSQLIAGVAAAAVVSALLPGPLPVATSLQPSMSIPRGLFLEMFLTSQLVLVVLTLEGGASKPMYIGATLFVAEICGVYFTGGSLNPARSFGPGVVTGFNGYDWIYWLGPALGAALGAGAYHSVRAIKGEYLKAA